MVQPAPSTASQLSPAEIVDMQLQLLKHQNKEMQGFIATLWNSDKETQGELQAQKDAIDSLKKEVAALRSASVSGDTPRTAVGLNDPQHGAYTLPQPLEHAPLKQEASGTSKESTAAPLSRRPSPFDFVASPPFYPGGSNTKDGATTVVSRNSLPLPSQDEEKPPRALGEQSHVVGLPWSPVAQRQVAAPPQAPFAQRHIAGSLQAPAEKRHLAESRQAARPPQLPLSLSLPSQDEEAHMPVELSPSLHACQYQHSSEVPAPLIHGQAKSRPLASVAPKPHVDIGFLQDKHHYEDGPYIYINLRTLRDGERWQDYGILASLFEADEDAQSRFVPGNRMSQSFFNKLADAKVGITDMKTLPPTMLSGNFKRCEFDKIRLSGGRGGRSCYRRMVFAILPDTLMTHDVEIVRRQREDGLPDADLAFEYWDEHHIALPNVRNVQYTVRVHGRSAYEREKHARGRTSQDVRSQPRMAEAFNTPCATGYPKRNGDHDSSNRPTKYQRG